MTKKTISYWAKEHSGSWQQKTIMHGRGIGKSKFIQEYINGVLQNQMRVLNKKHWPHQIRLSVNNQDTWDRVNEIERWCYETFKSANWRNDGLYFCFKRHDDATLFGLRWA